MAKKSANRKKRSCSPLLVGCVGGGCLLPAALFFGCAIFLGDTGGPLIWPIAIVVFGCFGTFLGMFIAVAANHTKLRDEA